MLVPLIDNHGHGLLSDFREVALSQFVSAFSTSKLASQMVADIAQSVVFLELQKRLLDISKTTSLIDYLALRQGRTDFAQDLVKDLFCKTGIERILFDDAYNSEQMMAVSDFVNITGVQVSNLVRIEPVLEKLISECQSPEAVEMRLEKSLFSGANQSIVALKTIVCYRGGLTIYEVEREDAIANFF